MPNQRKSKEDVLKEQFMQSVRVDGDNWFVEAWMLLDPSPSKSRILKAMEEYAKQEAIAFGEWLNETNWGEKETWGKHNPPSIPSTEELYTIFLTTKS